MIRLSFLSAVVILTLVTSCGMKLMAQTPSVDTTQYRVRLLYVGGAYTMALSPVLSHGPGVMTSVYLDRLVFSGRLSYLSTADDPNANVRVNEYCSIAATAGWIPFGIADIFHFQVSAGIEHIAGTRRGTLVKQRVDSTINPLSFFTMWGGELLYDKRVYSFYAEDRYGLIGTTFDVAIHTRVNETSAITLSAIGSLNEEGFSTSIQACLQLGFTW